MLEKIQADVKEALKSKDELEVSTLRMLLAAIKNFEISRGQAGYQATEPEIVSQVQKEIKSRKEAIEQFKVGGRQDLVDKETKEIKVLEKYLPEQINEQELRKTVTESISEASASSISDLGRVIGLVMSKVKGRAEGSVVSQIVKEELSKK